MVDIDPRTSNVELGVTVPTPTWAKEITAHSNAMTVMIGFFINWIYGFGFG
ncbi:hypothetical protein GCM10027043_40580 [Ferruginibacter profundus]